MANPVSPKLGIPPANEMPWATARPTLSPVKEPGPRFTTTPSNCFQEVSDAVKTSWISPMRCPAWPYGMEIDFLERTEASLPTATEQRSPEVSMPKRQCNLCPFWLNGPIFNGLGNHPLPIQNFLFDGFHHGRIFF